MQIRSTLRSVNIHSLRAVMCVLGLYMMEDLFLYTSLFHIPLVMAEKLHLYDFSSILLYLHYYKYIHFI